MASSSTVNNENIPPPQSPLQVVPAKRHHHESALHQGPRKKCVSVNPFVHHGRHFGRTVHALCNVHALITNGILRNGERADKPDEHFTVEERREHRIFEHMITSIPKLQDRLMDSSEEEMRLIADLIQKGASGARSDDTKSIKSAIIDWITPRGQSLSPPIARNVKTERGFAHSATGALLCPAGLDWSDPEIKKGLKEGDIIVAGDHWPILLYKNYEYDPEDVWKGLLRSDILVSTFKHIFTSPSSVEKEAKATRSGNAFIHGMTKVTAASLAYVATQARFALTSSPTFTRSDTVTDSHRFYTSLLDLLEDPEEKLEVCELFVWWNRQVFPSYSSAARAPSKGSALEKIRARRAALKSRQATGDTAPTSAAELLLGFSNSSVVPAAP